MKTPMDIMLEKVDWQVVTVDATNDDGLPVVTHSGVLDFAGYSLKCYQLDDGRAIIDADDLNAFFGAMLGDGEKQP